MTNFFDAFIEYGRADSKDFAIKLHARLLEQGLTVWFDQLDIPLGVDFQKEIDDGLEKAHNYLYIIAPASVNSPYCLKCLELAIKLNKRIIPILHVEQISQETWQQRFPNGKTYAGDDWETYKAQGKHTSYQNMRPEIAKINWVYFREGIDDFEQSFAGLVELMGRQADYVEQHTRFLVKALDWQRNHKKNNYLLLGEEREEAEYWLKRRFKDEQPPCLPTDLHCEFIGESTKNANNSLTQVYFCYSEKDKAVAEKVRKILLRESITVWTNKTAIKLSSEFQEGIEGADNFIYLISRNSRQSKYCQEELGYALAHNKRIISLLLEDTDTEEIPLALHTSQFIEFQEHEDEEKYYDSIEKLLNGLSLDTYYYEQHKIWLVKALKWERQNRNLSLLLRGSNLQRAEAWLNVAKQRIEHLPLPLHGEFIAESLRQLSDSSLDVFIAYCRADSDFAQKLNEELQLQGKTTWFNQEYLASDSDFQQEIKPGIESSDNFLFIVSPSSVNSSNWDVVEYAQKLNKRFVTVLHTEVATKDLHPALASVQAINFNKHGGNFSANFTELVRILDTDRDYVRNHTQLLQRALKWNLKDKSTDLLLRGKELESAEQWLNKAEQQNKQPTVTSLQKELITKSGEATKNFFDVFISYGRPDSKEFVIKLHDGLVSQGLKVWLDKNDIPPAVDFQNQINDGIEKASNFLFVISPHSVNSDYCRKEIELANQLNKRIIPILHVGEINEENWRKTWQQRKPNGKLEDWEAFKAEGRHTSFKNMHPTISKINWVLGFQEGQDDLEASFTGLVNLIRKHSDYVERHNRFLIKALEWSRNHKKTNYLLIQEERKKAESWLKERFKNEQAPCEPTDLHCEFICESTKNANNLMTQVFLAYAEPDKAVMELLRNSLWRESITVWTNNTDIQTGEVSEEAINRGIEQADSLVYVLSPDSITSTFCQQELDYALSLNKRIIPILVRQIDHELVPIALRNLQYIDLTDNVKAEDYRLDESQLLKILHQDERYYEEHKILLVKALKWDRQKRNPSILLRGHNLEYYENWLKVNRQRREHPPLPLHLEFIETSSNQPPESSLEIFISYSRADSDFARKLNEELQSYGKTTWFDQESIPPGSDFQQEIYQGIANSDNFLFVISPRSVNSPYCKDEVEYAQKLNKRFVTVLHRAVSTQDLHSALASIQWIDFRYDGDFSVNFSELVRTLDTDREHVKSHTKWSQRVLEWEQRGKTKDLLLRGSEFSIAQQWLLDAEQHNRQPAATPLQKEYIRKSRDALFAEIKQDKHQAHILKLMLGLVSAGFVISLGVGVFAFSQWKRAELVEQGQISSLSRYSLALSDKARKFDALIEAIRAGRQLQKLYKVNPATESLVLTALQTAVYGDEFIERERLAGHDNDVNSVSFSPNGQLIATASRDKTVKLWSRDGKLLHTFSNDANVNSVSFSPDGQTLATAIDKAVKIWSRDGKLLQTLPHDANVNSVSFSPDGQTLASGSNKIVKLWSRNGKLLQTLPHDDWVNSVSFSPDGQTLASGSNKIVKLWSRDGKLLQTLPHDNWVNSVSFSPDGQTLASGSSDKTVKLWSRDGRLIQTLPHENEVVHVTFSPDGQTIASASRDSTVQLWSRGGKVLKTLFHNTNVNSVSFSRDGKLIATASGDKTAKLWNRDGQLLQTLPHDNWVNSVSFSPDGQTIATASYKAVKLWSLNGQLLQTLADDNWVSSVGFSPDGQLIVSASGDKTVKLWSRNGQLLQTLPHDSWVNSVSFSPNGQLIVSASGDSKVKLWSRNGKLLQTFSHDDAVYSVSFSPDGKTIASASDDNTIKLWSRDGKLRKTLSYDTQFKSISFSPDGTIIAAASGDKTVKLWSLEGELLQTLKGHDEQVNSVSFSPDGKTIASASKDGTVILWNLEDLRLNQLMQDACDWVGNYLKYNAEESDRTLCDGIDKK
ncbi:MAG TPA: TIR domain-containing protein [Waterburya sp.]